LDLVLIFDLLFSAGFGAGLADFAEPDLNKGSFGALALPLLFSLASELLVDPFRSARFLFALWLSLAFALPEASPLSLPEDEEDGGSSKNPVSTFLTIGRDDQIVLTESLRIWSTYFWIVRPAFPNVGAANFLFLP
jgi:hypothetical protein